MLFKPGFPIFDVVVKRIFFALIAIWGHLNAQNKDTIRMPDIIITSPGLTPIKVSNMYGEDTYALVIDTSNHKVIKEGNYSVEWSPIFNYLEYFKSRLNYHDEAIEYGVFGNIYAGFNINDEGKLINIRILKKLYPKLDDMLIKILEECPPFNPKWCHSSTFFIQKVKFKLID